jgi:hypothetical protein
MHNVLYYASGKCKSIPYVLPPDSTMADSPTLQIRKQPWESKLPKVKEPLNNKASVV